MKPTKQDSLAEGTDILKRTDLALFPRLSPELAREVSVQYTRARERVILAALRCWKGGAV